MSSADRPPFRVLIAGGGVAALEAALALRTLAGELVATMLLAPEPEFVYRPMRVLEPFAYPAARRYPLADLVSEIGAEFREDAVTRVDPVKRSVFTEGGDELSYDALLLAPGARLRPRFEHALTIDDRRLDEQLHGLIQDVEDGYVSKLAFVAPTRMPWPLPMYELALLTARRAWDMNTEVSITLVTPEDSPLAIFGATVSQAVERLLVKRGILTIPSAHAQTPEPGQISLHPGARRLQVDRVVALPELFGREIPGIPRSGAGEFIPVDLHSGVVGLDRVYAAGDATEFPVKHGGIAAQQADAAAEAIAALAGASVEPRPFEPVVRAILLGADKPLYLQAHITGGHGWSSDVSEDPLWSAEAKIVARYLTPFLESRERAAVR
jgi:sulfide:quinone oxidoreductase